jgi:hypothetical protein
MRSRLSRCLRHMTLSTLTVSVVLLGATGVLASAVGGPLGSNVACGCEAEVEEGIAVKFTEVEKGADTTGTVTNNKTYTIEVKKVVPVGLGGKILSTTCKLLKPNESCKVVQDNPPESEAIVVKDP